MPFVCMGCGFVICQCFNPMSDSVPGKVLDDSAAASCLPPTNVINVEFRSDARRIAELEERVAALGARLDEHIARPHTYVRYGPTITWVGSNSPPPPPLPPQGPTRDSSRRP